MSLVNSHENRLLLETDAEGRRNWDFARPAVAPADTGAGVRNSWACNCTRNSSSSQRNCSSCGCAARAFLCFKSSRCHCWHSGMKSAISRASRTAPFSP